MALPREPQQNNPAAGSIDRGNHELEETVKETLINNHYNDWFEEWKKDSTIDNRLDEEKILWAVNQVLQGR